MKAHSPAPARFQALENLAPEFPILGSRIRQAGSGAMIGE
jgi:hypothetical protein